MSDENSEKTEVPEETENVENGETTSEKTEGDMMVQQFLGMGFEIRQIRKCIAAAFGNAERAAEYLCNGMPGERIGPATYVMEMELRMQKSDLKFCLYNVPTHIGNEELIERISKKFDVNPQNCYLRLTYSHSVLCIENNKPYSLKKFLEESNHDLAKPLHVMLSSTEKGGSPQAASNGPHIQFEIGDFKIIGGREYEMINGKFMDIEGEEFKEIIGEQLKNIRMIAKSVDSGSLPDTVKYLSMVPKRGKFRLRATKVILNEALKCAVVKGYKEIALVILKSELEDLNPFVASATPGGCSLIEACKRNYIKVVEFMCCYCMRFTEDFVEFRVMKKCLQNAISLVSTEGYTEIEKILTKHVAEVLMMKCK